MKILLPAIIVAILAVPALAQPVRPKSELAGIAFLAGNWQSVDGEVPDTGETSTGSSTFGWEVGGTVLLRRDHTSLFNAARKMTRSFDQIMMIYPEDGTLHADYSDGNHVIHYTQAAILDGRSVVFTSTPQPKGPMFKLTYVNAGPQRLSVEFSMAQPGSMDFHPIATGVLTKRGGTPAKVKSVKRAN